MRLLLVQVALFTWIACALPMTDGPLVLSTYNSTTDTGDQSTSLSTRGIPHFTPRNTCIAYHEKDLGGMHQWLSFTIQGRGWDWVKLGGYGHGLKDNLKTCGRVTDWNFIRYAEGKEWDWVAFGSMMWMTAAECIGENLVKAGGAGGAGPDTCTGWDTDKNMEWGKANSDRGTGSDPYDPTQPDDW